MTLTLTFRLPADSMTFDLDGDYFYNKTLICLSDKYLNFKQPIEYYENSRAGLKLRMERTITDDEIRLLENTALTDDENKIYKLIMTLKTKTVTLNKIDTDSLLSLIRRLDVSGLDEVLETCEDNEDSLVDLEGLQIELS